MALPASRRRSNKNSASVLLNNNKSAKTKAMNQEQSGMAMSMQQAEQVMQAALKMQMQSSNVGMTGMIEPSKESGENQGYSHDHPQDRSPELDLNDRAKKRPRAAKQKAENRLKHMSETEDDIEQHQNDDVEYNSEEAGDRSDDPNEDPQDDNNQDRDEDVQEEEEQEEEPDWESIAQHEPAQTDVPVFLSARDHRDAADERFAAMLDECHKALHQAVDDLLNTAADIHNVQREKLDALELQLKTDFVCNEEARATMQRRLEESATAAQGLFAKLLMRVSQPLFAAAGKANSIPGQRPSTSSVTAKDYFRKKNGSTSHNNRKNRTTNKST